MFIIMRVIMDADEIKNKRIPLHWANALATIAVTAFLVWKNSRPEWFTIPYFLFIYQYCFDALLNWELHRPLSSIGQTAVTDRVERWVLRNDESKFGMWFIMKTIIFIGLVGSYIANF